MAALPFVTHPGTSIDVLPDFVDVDDVAELTARWVDGERVTDRWAANLWNQAVWAVTHRDPVAARHAVWNLGHVADGGGDELITAAVELVDGDVSDPRGWATLVLAAAAVETASRGDQVDHADDVWLSTGSVGDPRRLVATLRHRATRHFGDDALIDDVEALAAEISKDWNTARCGILVAWGDRERNGPTTFGRLVGAVCDAVTVTAGDGFLAAGVAPAAIVDRISELITSAPLPIAFYDTFDPQFRLSVLPVEHVPAAVATVEAVTAVAEPGASVGCVVELHHIADGGPLEVERVRSVAEHWNYSRSSSGFRSTVTEIAEPADAEAACRILDAVTEHRRILDDGALGTLAAQLSCDDGTVDTFTGLLGTWDGDLVELAASVNAVHGAPT